jgi:hypothetical protein
MRAFVVGLVLGFLGLACGGPAPTAPLGILDPGPGHQVDVAFTNAPPNDTPETATPLGTSTTANVTVWITGNAIGGASNPSNYFVFRSGPSAGTFAFDGCFAPPITGMTGGLWRVVDGKQQLPAVATWNSTGDGDAGRGCLANESAAMTANTIYLFGLTATGGAGQYAL